MIFMNGYQSICPPPQNQIENLPSAKPVVYAALAESVKPPPPLDFNKWAEDNIIFDKGSQFPGPYDRSLFPFFCDPLACLQPDHPARIVVLKKSAQVGGTVVAQVFAGASLDQDPTPFLYVHPSLDNAKRWVRTKWNSFVKLSRALKKIFSPDSSRDKTNSLYFKERKDGLGSLTISGANSAASLSMISMPKQVQDDLSKWENNDGGDSESQADSRSSGFMFRKVLKVSTPLIKGTCRISNAYDKSSQGVFEVPCPHCGHYQELTWENFKASLHEGMDFADAHFTCTGKDCGCAIEHSAKRDMVAKGRWRHKNPAAKRIGFYIWAAYSPLCFWSDIAEDYFDALGNPEKEQTFYNDKLGLEYEQKGEAPPWQNIQERADRLDGYLRGTVPPNGVIITCGCDVQGDRVEWHVKAFGPNLQRFTVDYGVIEGHISEAAAQKGLDVLLKQRFKNASGRYVGIDMLAIDANAYTDAVLDWARKHPDNKVIAVRGVKGEFASPLVPVSNDRKKGIKKKRKQKKFFNVGVSPLKASLFKHLEKDDKTERGYCGYPREMQADFFMQLCSERRILVTNKKNHYAHFEWHLLPGVRNEVLDTEIYAEAAARRLGWAELTDDQWTAIIAQRESAPQDGQLDMLDASLVKVTKEKPLEPVDVPDDEDDDEDDSPPPTPKKDKPKKSLAKKLA